LVTSVTLSAGQPAALGNPEPAHPKLAQPDSTDPATGRWQANRPRLIVLPRAELALALFGQADVTLRAIEAVLPNADIHVRGNRITINGAEAALAEQLIKELIMVVDQGGSLGSDDVKRALTMLRQSGTAAPVMTSTIMVPAKRQIRPKTTGQKRYVDAIDRSIVTFAIGPAGTGKTYLAMAKAVEALHAKRVSRIVLTRPAVEAGERLGYLPGTLSEKIDPYLRPLHDALQDMMDADVIARLIDNGTIEVAPLAYMRGRTLNDAFIILDEAQNTSAEQMKMFLTRLGFHAKMVVTGDVTQTDLPSGSVSGLLQARDLLGNLDDLTFCELNSQDVVRHHLVAQIIEAYARSTPRPKAATAAPYKRGQPGQRRRTEAAQSL
jgi:phosphate starvation-inducible PhoH-like protein